MIRVAILGAGIGREHLAAYHALPAQFEVCHIVDRDLARIEEIRGDASFAACADVAEVLQNPSVDLIDICLPPNLHKDTCLAALKAGKHVICEKPLATSLEDVDQIIAAAKDADRKVFPVFQYRYGPALAQFQTLLDSGKCGRPLVASLETHWNRGRDYYAVPWRGTWQGEQGGAVLCHAIHNHDLLTRFFGPLAQVSAMTTTRVNPIQTEDCAAISFQFESGALATSSITLGAATDESRMRFVFENVTAESARAPYAPGSEPWTFTARGALSQPDLEEILKGTYSVYVGFEGFFDDIAKHLSGQENNAVMLEDGRRSIELVSAIYHASRTQRPVALPLGEDFPLYASWQPDQG